MLFDHAYISFQIAWSLGVFPLLRRTRACSACHVIVSWICNDNDDALLTSGDELLLLLLPLIVDFDLGLGA